MFCEKHQIHYPDGATCYGIHCASPECACPRCLPYLVESVAKQANAFLRAQERR